MSFEATKWAWAQPVDKSSYRLVLLALADRADQSGYCYPSKSRISKDTCLDVKTVKRAIQHLEETRTILVVRQQGRVNKFWLIMDGVCHVPKKYQGANRTDANIGPTSKGKITRGVEPKLVPEPVNESIIESNIETDGGIIVKSGRAKLRLPDSYSPFVDKVSDYLEQQSLMNSKFTQSRLDLLLREIDKVVESTGRDIDEIVDVMLLRGWRSVQAVWIEDHFKGSRTVLDDLTENF